MRGIRHTGIYVTKLEEMKNFYCDNFLMTVVSHEIEEGNYIDAVLGLTECHIEIYKLQCENGTVLELLHMEQSAVNIMCDMELHRQITDNGCIHIAFTVDDVDVMYKQLKKIGIEFISVPCIASTGRAKVCFCRDIEGNYIELVEEVKV